jgi:FAM210A/B-like domain
MAEYGVIAVIVYFTIFFATWIGAWAAIQRGVDLAALAARVGLSSNRIVANLGAWTAAYIFTKILQPVRIGVTLLLTPVMARLYERTIAVKR